MTANRTDLLAQYKGMSDFFCTLFFELPDEEFARNVLSIDFGTDTGALDNEELPDAEKGMALIDAYVRSCAKADIAGVLEELAVDRTRLFRGLTKDGPRPPYESLYRGAVANDMVLSVNDSYRAGGCHKSRDIKDAPDHIGVEISFMGWLAQREMQALAEGDEAEAGCMRDVAATFMIDHLGCWGAAFGDEMLRFADTDFFRGVAYLLKASIDEGRSLYAR